MNIGLLKRNQCNQLCLLAFFACIYINIPKHSQTDTHNQIKYSGKPETLVKSGSFVVSFQGNSQKKCFSNVSSSISTQKNFWMGEKQEYTIINFPANIKSMHGSVGRAKQKGMSITINASYWWKCSLKSFQPAKKKCLGSPQPTSNHY